MAPTSPTRHAPAKPVPAAIQIMEKRIQSADPLVRAQALDSIPKTNPPVEPLCELIGRLLEHQNWFVRLAGADAISRAAELETAGKHVLVMVAAARLDHEDHETRRCAARGMVAAAQGGPSLAKASTADGEVTEEIVEEQEPGRGRAPAKRGSVSYNLAELAASEMAAKLNHPDPRVRQLVVESLGDMGPWAEPHAQAMGFLLADEDVSVRTSVFRTLEIMGTRSVGAASVAARLLGSNNSTHIRSGHLALLVMSGHSGPAAAEAAAYQLSIDENDPELPHDALLDPEERASREVRKRAACSCLSEMGALAGAHSKLLAVTLEDKDPAVRAAAVRALMCAGDAAEPAVRQLRKLLNSNRVEVRKAAVDALRGLSFMSSAFTEIAGTMLQDEASGGGKGDGLMGRMQALEILGGSGANAIPYLSDIGRELEHPDWSVRRAALEALTDLGEHTAGVAKEIAMRLTHAETDVRRAAAQALGYMGKSSAGLGARLQTCLLAEDDVEVQKAMEQALNQLVSAGVYVRPQDI